jgi:hypothetical protein
LLEKHQPLLETAYLRSIWAKEYEAFKNSPENDTLFTRLKTWAAKDQQKETTSENAFIDVFFKQTWGYFASGETEKKYGYTLQQQYPVKGAGQGGGTGKADIALGYFGRENMEGIPQVLGEFKDDRSGLDKPQTNRPNDRTPVDQCLDYLREARTGLISSILPTWALVTDMNEFRLYLYGDKARFQRFVIKSDSGDTAVSLLGESEEAAFQRFLFKRMFHSEWLLTTGGNSKLGKLLGEQIIHEQVLENEFYQEYRAYREAFYQSLRKHNPKYEQEGRLRQLVKFTQRILDRCIFILYCEDMGRELNFPPNVLRDILIEVGEGKYFFPDAENAWTAVKQLFISMRDGTPFGSERINNFNGGLFEEDPEMDALRVPNRVFCEQNQGQTEDRLLRYPKTLLYFSAKYNFGTINGGRGRTLTLTTMGRIFEQSITDLEVMEAHAEGRESLTEITKRKRDGVYYTPEWVTYYIVEETVGARLAEIRRELGFDKFTDVTAEQIKEYQKDRRKSKVVGAYEKSLRAYRVHLDQLKVVDPACGSGAFLIQAFKYLYDQRQWIANELERVTGSKELFEIHSVMREVLSKNLYGVDINAESVEITRLALWLHTALPDRPLTALDRNIRCGNSLIGHDFYRQMGINRELFGENERERVNTFDWKEAFPDVFERDNPGFDCVIGNPPYVKLQHFRKVEGDVAEYLVIAVREGGGPLYDSTQTGNFDMYLPFIERGTELLNKQGKMGYIAPNVWMVNEYGRGLRQKLKRTRRLDRWIDFKSFQVFDEAITYTALQFFTGFEQDRIRCVFAPGGKEKIAGVDWREVKDAVYYKDLPGEDSWVLMSNDERRLHDKLRKRCKRLDESCKGIIVGIQTSADHIYHLERIGPNRYRQKPRGNKTPVDVEIEDAIMHPLVSGPEAKRYQVPNTSTYILFPYEVRNGNVYLFTMKEMESRFPKTWAYLKSYEKVLRSREMGKFDDGQWYRLGRNQNIDKQDIPKLMVPRLVIQLFTAVDETGIFYLDNVDVNGILVNDSTDLFFLAGILNSPTANFIWRRISKPFQNDYRSANKQFIAPLPIPNASDEEKGRVAGMAKKLQELHTKRRDFLLMIDKRLESTQCEDDNRNEGWLWADVKPLTIIKKEAPPELKGKELTDWARSQRESLLAVHLDNINPSLRPGVKLTAAVEYGELKLMADGVPLIEGIFPGDDEAAFIAAQWRQKTRQTNVTEKFDAKRLTGLLLKLRKTGNPEIMKQVVRIDADIQEFDIEISRAEADMNALTYRLYKLTEDEIRLVEEGEKK